MTEHTDPGIMEMMREMCARLSEVGLTETQTHAIVAAYDAIVAERDAAVHQIKIAKVCNDSQAELIERLTLEKMQRFDELNTLRARLAACERDAERYQFLRKRDPQHDVCLHCGYDGLALNVGEELDRVVDTARSAVAAETQGDG